MPNERVEHTESGRAYMESDAIPIEPICFRCRLKEKQEDLPPEFSEIVDKYFWDLV